MINSHLSIHHVGGRAGSRAFPVMDLFEKDIINVLYDADPECIDQIRERNKSLKSQLHVLPYCLGANPEQSILNINYDPYTSSRLIGNPEYNSYYSYLGENGDYIFSEVTQTIERRKVELLSMDYIFQNKMISLPMPDFLSIDTQGYEYEILKGAKNILESSVLSLVVEVSFHPMYENQKLFGDICNLLSGHGFMFVRFLDFAKASPYRAPKGQRSEEFQMGGDALFLKKVDFIETKKMEFLQSYIMLKKLAFISIAYNQFEYGILCLNSAKKIKFNMKESVRNELESMVYSQFLANLEVELNNMPIFFPKTFCELFTLKESLKRFSCDDNKSATTKRYGYVVFLKQFPIIVFLCRWVINIPRKAKKMLTGIKYRGYLLCYSGLEKILIKYGLKEQAICLQKTRVRQLFDFTE